METLQDQINKLMKESEERYAEDYKLNDNEGMDREDSYLQALYDILNWVNENKTSVEVYGGELDMVAV